MGVCLSHNWFIYREAVLARFDGRMFEPQTVRRKYAGMTLSAPLSSIVACRLREGYSITNISTKSTKDGEVNKARGFLGPISRANIARG